VESKLAEVEAKAAELAQLLAAAEPVAEEVVEEVVEEAPAAETAETVAP